MADSKRRKSTRQEVTISTDVGPIVGRSDRDGYLKPLDALSQARQDLLFARLGSRLWDDLLSAARVDPSTWQALRKKRLTVAEFERLLADAPRQAKLRRARAAPSLARINAERGTSRAALKLRIQRLQRLGMKTGPIVDQIRGEGVIVSRQYVADVKNGKR